jgi:hypothetical protein
MGFMDSYKRLEKLCGEVMDDNRRVSAYIDEMLRTPRGSYLVRGWDEDLKRLKHYRWVRNEIVHNPTCTEETMCEWEDVQWIMDFHTRIMNQTDPLALYYKTTKPHSTGEQRPASQSHLAPRPVQPASGCTTALLFALAVGVLVAVLLH